MKTFVDLKTMEKELYFTHNKLISKLNIYFDLSPSQFNDIMINIQSHIKISAYFDVQSE